jgi:hypothetical protein
MLLKVTSAANLGDLSDADKTLLQSQLDLLRNQTAALMDKAIKQTPISTNSSLLFGNDMYSMQLSSSSNASLSDSIKIALDNRLSIIDADACIKTLKKHYGISESTDLIVAKSDINSFLELDNLNKPLASNTAKVSIYDPVTREELNMTLCENDQFNIKTPIKSTGLLNLTQYQALKAQGIDVYNPNDESFSSICATKIDNNTNFDTTVNFRRENYYQNMSVGCGSNCNYSSIDEFGYVHCNCTSMTPNTAVGNDFVNYVLAPLSTWNYEVALCYNLIIPVNIFITPSRLRPISGCI